jgi:hypothetical protein
MPMTWLEAIQFVGLDLQIVLLLAVAGLGLADGRCMRPGQRWATGHAALHCATPAARHGASRSARSVTSDV